MRLLTKVIPVFFAVFLSGCATIFNGGNQNIHLSAPDNKQVKVVVSNAGNQYERVLPSTIIAVHDMDSVSIMVKGAGYRDAIYVVPKSITPSFWVNVLFWPGFLLDLATGNMWKYPTNYTIPLHSYND